MTTISRNTEAEKKDRQEKDERSEGSPYLNKNQLSLRKKREKIVLGPSDDRGNCGTRHWRNQDERGEWENDNSNQVHLGLKVAEKGKER